MENKKQLLILAERLRKLRKKKKESQEHISEVLGYKKGTYGTYENARYLPDAYTIRELAKYYNVSSDYLLGLSDTPNLLPISNNEVYIKILQNINPDILNILIELNNKGYNSDELKTSIDLAIALMNTKTFHELKK